MSAWHPETPLEYQNQIVTGDARVLAERIPDGSVDLILCDPPYLKSTMHLYSWLGEFAARGLKPGGYLAAYCGTEHLPTAMACLSQHLQWFWLLAMRHNGAYPLMAYKRIMVAYKPILLYSKGRPARVEYLVDSFDTDLPDKAYHRWGQGQKLPWVLVNKWTARGETVCDPFTGGGTVPAVCKMLQRNYIAFEIDPDAAARARERVAITQVPNPILMGEQMLLEEATP